GLHNGTARTFRRLSNYPPGASRAPPRCGSSGIVFHQGGLMTGKAVIFGVAVATILCGDKAQAGEKEPTAIVAIGPALEWSLSSETTRVGPSASVEFSLIKDWLELEIGGGTLFRKGRPEWEADVLFKKPFTLSETAELMLGAGPSWSYSRGE